MFRKLEFDAIYYAYFNESPFKYHISISRGVMVWGHSYFAYLGGGGPEFGKTCLYNTCTLPYYFFKTIPNWHSAGETLFWIVFQMLHGWCTTTLNNWKGYTQTLNICVYIPEFHQPCPIWDLLSRFSYQAIFIFSLPLLIRNVDTRCAQFLHL